MSDTQTIKENVEQVRCEYCHEESDEAIIHPDYLTISITKLNTISGTRHQEPIHICTEHVPAPLHPQDGLFSFVFDMVQRRITGGVVWREGEYPYEKNLQPELFPDRILGLAMIVQQALNGRGDI